MSKRHGRPKKNSVTRTPQARAAKKWPPSCKNTRTESISRPQKTDERTLRTVSIKRKSNPYGLGTGCGEHLRSLFTRPRIDVAKLLKRIDRLHIVGIHAGFHNAIDIGKAAAIVQEGIDGDLVGGIEHARHGATRLAGTFGQRQTAEGIHVGSIKRELPQLAEIDTRRRGIPTLGIRERELDGNTHVGSTEMRHHGAVGRTRP